MSTAFFIVVENENPGFDVSVNGKFLAKAWPQLKAIAAALGIKSLMDFYGADDSEMAKEFASPNAARFKAKWFEARDGLASVRALLGHIEQDLDSVERSASVIADLREFERVLAEAERRELKWHMEVDY